MEILDTRKTGEDPLDIITQKEYFTVIEKAIDDSLSDFEKKVLVHYKNGESYAEIAEILQSKVKSVDTAIQRIQKKSNEDKTKNRRRRSRKMKEEFLNLLKSTNRENINELIDFINKTDFFDAPASTRFTEVENTG